MNNLEFVILNLIQQVKNPFLNGFFTFITHLGDGGVLWLFVAVSFIIYGKYKKNQNTFLCGISMLMAIVTGFITGNLILKPLIARPRPFDGLDIKLLITSPKDFSFPSGHTLSSFAAGVSILLRNKKLGIVAIILASLIAFSRMYLYVHFPSDILAGILLGTASAYFSKYITNKVYFLTKKH